MAGGRPGYREFSIEERVRIRGDLVRLLPTVGWPLAGGLLAATVLSGLLTPAFNIASGAIAGAAEQMLRSGDRADRGALLAALGIATGIYLLIHILGPVLEGMGSAVMRRLDVALMARVMRAVAAPRGVAHLEDPRVLDRIAQAQGVITGSTPGAGAYYLVQVWARRLQGTASLLIVSRFSVLLAAGLFAAHLVNFRWQQWHWRQVTNVIFNSADGLRRSHYLRRLAVEAPAAKEVRVFGLSAWLRGRYRETFLEVMDDVWATRRHGGVVVLGVNALLFVTIGGAIALVARSAIVGETSLAAAVVYAQSIIASTTLGSYSQAHVYVNEGGAALGVLRDLEASLPPAAALTGSTPVPPDSPRRSIRFEGVEFCYAGRDEPVYRGLDLEIEAGTSLAIVGENGAGKTTLVKLLCRLHDPTAGRILVDGVPLIELDPAAWQRRVAAIFQDFVQLHLPAGDNVALGAWHLGRNERLLERAADLAGASGLVERLPQGWDTVLSRQYRGGVDLSGGEWQRIALARAMYAVLGGAGVLILDEPTASLDVRGEAEIYDRFLQMTEGLTTIVISHRFSTVRRADRIVVVEQGVVVEDGTHDTLVAAGGRYASMYELQAARFTDVEEIGA